MILAARYVRDVGRHILAAQVRRPDRPAISDHAALVLDVAYMELGACSSSEIGSAPCSSTLSAPSRLGRWFLGAPSRPVLRSRQGSRQLPFNPSYISRRRRPSNAGRVPINRLAISALGGDQGARSEIDLLLVAWQLHCWRSIFLGSVSRHWSRSCCAEKPGTSCPFRPSRGRSGDEHPLSREHGPRPPQVHLREDRDQQSPNPLARAVGQQAPQRPAARGDQ